jgi:hypothetical protein
MQPSPLATFVSQSDAAGEESRYIEAELAREVPDEVLRLLNEHAQATPPSFRAHEAAAAPRALESRAR